MGGCRSLSLPEGTQTRQTLRGNLPIHAAVMCILEPQQLSQPPAAGKDSTAAKLGTNIPCHPLRHATMTGGSTGVPKGSGGGERGELGSGEKPTEGLDRII